MVDTRAYTAARIRHLPGDQRLAWQIALPGVGGLVYGRRLNCSPPVVLRGEDPLDLRDQVRGYLGRLP